MANAFTTHQAVNQGTSVSSLATTITAPASGNILVVFVASVASSGTAARTVSTITCTNVTGFAKIAATPNGKNGLEIWVGSVGASAGTSVTVTLSASAANFCVNIAEFSGCTVTTDGTQGGTTGTSVTPSTSTWTVASSSDLMLVAAAWANGTSPTAQPGSYSSLTGEASSTSLFLQPDYLLAGVSGSQTASTWTITSAVWMTCAIGLKVVLIVKALAASQAQTQGGVSRQKSYALTVSQSAMSGNATRVKTQPANAGAFSKSLPLLPSVGRLGKNTILSIPTSWTARVGVTAPAGSVLIVNIASNSIVSNVGPSDVKFNGVSLTLFLQPSTPGGTFHPYTSIYALLISVDTTGDIVVTFAAGAVGNTALSAYYVANCASFQAVSTGSFTAYSPVTSTITDSVIAPNSNGHTLYIGVLALAQALQGVTLSSSAFGNGWTTGQIAGTGSGANDVTIQEGYYIDIAGTATGSNASASGFPVFFDGNIGHNLANCTIDSVTAGGLNGTQTKATSALKSAALRLAAILATAKSSAGTVYTQTLSASLAAWAVVRQSLATKNIAGASGASSAVVIKQAAKAEAGGLAHVAGSAMRSALRLFASSGNAVSGSVLNRAGKTATGSQTLSASTAKQPGKSLVATGATGAAQVSRQTVRSLTAASIAWAGATSFLLLRQFAASANLMSATLARVNAKNSASSLAQTAAVLLRSTGHSLGGAAQTVAAGATRLTARSFVVADAISNATQTVQTGKASDAATATANGNGQKQIGRNLTGTSELSGNAVKTASTFLSASMGIAASVAKAVATAFGAVAETAGTNLGRSTSKLSSAVTSVWAAAIQTSRGARAILLSFAASFSLPAAGIFRTTEKPVTASANLAGAIGRVTAQTQTATAAVAGSVSRAARISLTGSAATLAASLTFGRLILQAFLAATAASAAYALRLTAKDEAAASAQPAGGLSRATELAITSNVATSGSVSRRGIVDFAAVVQGFAGRTGRQITRTLAGLLNGFAALFSNSFTRPGTGRIAVFLSGKNILIADTAVADIAMSLSPKNILIADITRSLTVTETSARISVSVIGG